MKGVVWHSVFKVKAKRPKGVFESEGVINDNYLIYCLLGE